MSVAPGFLHSIWANTQERGYMAWSDWQSSITGAYQTPVCNYPGSIWLWDLICTRIIVTKMCAERGTAPRCDPSIIFISMFSPANTRQLSLLAHCFLSAFLDRQHRCSFSFYVGFWYLHLTFGSRFVIIIQPLAVKVLKFYCSAGSQTTAHEEVVGNKLWHVVLLNIKQWPVFVLLLLVALKLDIFPSSLLGG